MGVYMSFSVLLEILCRFDQSEAQFLLGVLQLHPFQLVPRLLDPQVGVGVHRYANLGMTHKVLQRFGIHTAFCLVGAVGMAAHMGRNQGKLFLINAVVLLPGVLEVMLPMHCHHRAVILVKEQETRIKTLLGRAIELIPGKTENWLMLQFEDNCRLWFRGENENPMAMVQVQVFGKAKAEYYDALTKRICALLEEYLSIQPENIYVKYEETSHWGWNGSNF